MKKATGESLSALMDQQADDLDVQRVVNGLEDEELLRRWRRYHVASAAMRNELDEFASVDLTLAIQQRLPQESATMLARQQRPRFAGVLKPVASVAVAASVTAAILGGAQLYHAMVGDPVALPALAAGNANGDVSAALAVSRSVGFGGPMVQASSPAGLAVVDGRVPRSQVQESLALDYSEADAMARKKLNAHLQSHLENASLNTSSGMMPFARAASDQGER